MHGNKVSLKEITDNQPFSTSNRHVYNKNVANSEKYLHSFDIIPAVENLISTDNLIESAKKKGIDFGKGDPYNRLRYYTKIGWLPHMVRKSDKEGSISGHYPEWALGHLILIEQLKSRNASNEEISRQLKLRNKLQGVLGLFTSRESRTQLLTYLIVFLLLLLVANQYDLIRLGKPKSGIAPNTANNFQVPAQIIDNGTAFIPKNQNIVFVRSQATRTGMKAYVSFNQNYSPAVRYWVSEMKDFSGFTVELDAPVSNNVEFNWWLSY